MKVSRLTDAEVREAYFELVDAIYRYERDSGLEYADFWVKLGYEYFDRPET